MNSWHLLKCILKSIDFGGLGKPKKCNMLYAQWSLNSLDVVFGGPWSGFKCLKRSWRWQRGRSSPACRCCSWDLGETAQLGLRAWRKRSPISGP